MLSVSATFRPLQRLASVSRILTSQVLASTSSPSSSAQLQDVPDRTWTIPNALCIARICATPVIGYLVVHEAYAGACGLLFVAGATDLLDGWIARKFASQRSMLGTMLDPVADKLLISTLFVTLAYTHLIPVTLACIVFLRDFLLLFGAFAHRWQTLTPPRTFGRYFNPSISSIEIRPTFASKLNTVLQLATVALSLGAPIVDCSDHSVLTTLWLSTAATTVYSGWQYIGGSAIKSIKPL